MYLRLTFNSPSLHGILSSVGRTGVQHNVQCGGLNENGPHGLIYLNAWPSVGRMIWKGSGGVALLGCVLVGLALTVQKCLLFPVRFLSLYFVLVDQM